MGEKEITGNRGSIERKGKRRYGRSNREKDNIYGAKQVSLGEHRYNKQEQ